MWRGISENNYNSVNKRGEEEIESNGKKTNRERIIGESVK